MCNGKNGLGKQITVIPSELGNFLLNRKQKAELKPVAHLTEICSNKWPCTLLFIMWQEGQTGLMAEGFWEEEMITVQKKKPTMVIATELRSREREAGDEPRGEVMGLGNSQIMQHIFFKWELIYRAAWFLPFHLSVPGKWLMWWGSGNVTPKTDLPVTPKSCSELCRGNLGSGMWPAITEDGDVCVVLMELPSTN